MSQPEIRNKGGRPRKVDVDYYDEAMKDLRVVMGRKRRRALLKKIYEDALGLSEKAGSAKAQELLMNKIHMPPPTPPKREELDITVRQAVAFVRPSEAPRVIEGEVRQLGPGE